MKHWFISDLHIRNINERNGNTLLRFLFYLNQKPSEHSLYLLGDIFDFWLSDGLAFQKHYSFLIEQIKIFKNQGGQVFYFEGNHDFHIDRFWTKKLNIVVFENDHHFEIGKFKVRCEHGDFINPEDQAYLKYRETIRKPWLEFIGHLLPGFFWKWLGEKLSEKSRKKTSYYAIEFQDKIKKMIQTYAEKVSQSNDFDILITGHMHVFDDFRFTHQSNKVKRSINLGTWLDKPRVFVIDDLLDTTQVYEVEKLINS